MRYRKFVSEELIVSGYAMEAVTRAALVVQVLYLFCLSACSYTGHVYYIYGSDLMLSFVFSLKVQNKFFISAEFSQQVCNLPFRVENVM